MIVGYIGGLENSPRWVLGFPGFEFLDGFPQQALSTDVVEITKADVRTIFEALLHQTGANAIGTSCGRKSEQKSLEVETVKRAKWTGGNGVRGERTGNQDHFVLEGLRGNLGNVLRH